MQKSIDKQKRKKNSKFTPGNFELKVKRSSAGLGLFAGQDIPKGKCVIEYFGRIVSKKEEETSRSKYLFEIRKGKTIDGAARVNIARYVNYSHRPNCESEIYKDKVYYFSIRPIKTGQELTVDYGKEYYDEHIKPYGCRCEICVQKAR